jgi:hypothetical protein
VAAFGVEQIQNGSHCHGNQGAKNVKFTPNFTNFCSNASRNKKKIKIPTFLFPLQLQQSLSY